MFPDPSQRGTAIGHSETASKGGEVQRKIGDAEPLSIFVFKTLADPFSGRISYFKVMSGVLKNDAMPQNFTRGTSERLQHIQVMQGKTPTAVPELHAGDLGTVAKLKETFTGDTLGDKAAPIHYPLPHVPEPSITFAVEPKTRADEDRIGPAIHRILEEDPSLRFSRDPQTKEFLLAGSGQQHIEVVVAKLHKRYHVDLTLKPPKVPYRETIRGKADAEGKHKKQTGPESNSWTTSSAARSPRTGSRRSRKASALRPSAAISPVSLSWISGRSFTTANITTWTAPTWRSRSPDRWRSRKE
jgi:elongation factor G